MALLKPAGAARDAVCGNRNSRGRNRDLSANIGCRCMPLLTSAYQPSIRRNACPTARWKASRPRLDVDESTCVHACPSVLRVNETWERAALDTFHLYAMKRPSICMQVYLALSAVLRIADVSSSLLSAVTWDSRNFALTEITSVGSLTQKSEKRIARVRRINRVELEVESFLLYKGIIVQNLKITFVRPRKKFCETVAQFPLESSINQGSSI